MNLVFFICLVFQLSHSFTKNKKYGSTKQYFTGGQRKPMQTIIYNDNWAKRNRDKLASGIPIRPGAAPFLVSLLHKNLDIHFCSGAIVLPDIVLTTAMCATSFPFEDIVFVAGGVISSYFEGVEQVALPESVTVHRKFVPSDTTPTDDIAIFHVWPSFKFNDLVGGIQLPTSSLNLRDQTPLMVFGVDSSGLDVRKERKKIKEASATIVFAMSSTDCLQEFQDAQVPLQYFPQFICTSGGFLRGRSCHGDRGSALITISEVTGQAGLVGLLTWMAACESPGFPGVFTKLSHYSDWINRQIQEIKNPSTARTKVKLSSMI